MNEYNIGYLDGRNHALSLTTKLVSSLTSKRVPREILQVLSDRQSLEAALYDFDTGFFNNYDEQLGLID